jgi:hypothetical protein
MSSNKQDFKISVPEKVIGVTSGHKASFHDQPQEHPSPNFENAMMVVDDLQEHSDISIKGSVRRISEAIAHYNRKGIFPTKSDVRGYLKDMSPDAIRKTIQRIHNMHGDNLIIILPQRKGHEHQYVLANMQHMIKVKEEYYNCSNKNKVMDSNASIDSFIESLLVAVLRNKPNPEFHHITLETYLKYPNEDYKRLNYTTGWHMSSVKNRAKTFEYRISAHRECTIISYPNGVVMITIKATLHPFKWHDRAYWIQLMAICGSIHQILKGALSVCEPLIHASEADWLVKQIDIGYDIPTSPLDNSKSSSTKGAMSIPRLFDGCLKVSHLDRVYQVYNKQLPYKGNCIRAEEQLHFPSPSGSPSPALSSLSSVVIPPSLEDILDMVLPSNSPSSIAHHNNNNPLYRLKDLEVE